MIKLPQGKKPWRKDHCLVKTVRTPWLTTSRYLLTSFQNSVLGWSIWNFVLTSYNNFLQQLHQEFEARGFGLSLTDAREAAYFLLTQTAPDELLKVAAYDALHQVLIFFRMYLGVLELFSLCRLFFKFQCPHSPLPFADDVVRLVCRIQAKAHRDRPKETSGTQHRQSHLHNQVCDE